MAFAASSLFRVGLTQKLEIRELAQLVYKFGSVQLGSIFKQAESRLNLNSFS
jgi:hypothetical protein